ncbi:MAG: LysR family transcriptional regulator [Gammaproteobacteria bacterium]
MPGIRVLRYLLAVADTGHFGRAAERCEVSQSTLSGQLSRFEDHLGVTLIQRTRGRATLTEAGERVRPWAELILHASSRMRAAAQGESGHELPPSDIPFVGPDTDPECNGAPDSGPTNSKAPVSTFKGLFDEEMNHE